MRYIIVDGSDGSGKSTQLKMIQKLLESKGIPVHTTKGLGGDGSDEFQNALRTVLLHNKFPKNNLTLEETLFAVSDLEGIKIARDFLERNPKGVVLKDRGPVTHYVYARSRGMGHDEAMAIHNEVFALEKQLGRNFGMLTLMFLPTDIQKSLDRVIARQKAVGAPISERLENIEIQTKVVDNFKTAIAGEFGDVFNVVQLDVRPEEGIEDVAARVQILLDAHGIV